MTTDAFLAIGQFSAATLGFAAMAVIEERAWRRRQKRRRQARWAQRYYREGGLVRTLIARWRKGDRLTDQRDNK